MAADQLNRGRLRVATYNVHDCIGRDGVYSPGRIAAVVTGLDADVVALQEVTLDHAGDLVGLLQSRTRMRAVDGTVFERGIGRYGNLLLSRLPLRLQQLHDISFAGREPRGIIESVVESDLTAFSVFATHLGLVRRERRVQIAALAGMVERAPRPVVVLGDLNSWPGCGALAPLRQAGLSGPVVRSFPSWPWPLLALDRVLASPPLVVLQARRVTGATVAAASDHLPVVADIGRRRAEDGISGTATGTPHAGRGWERPGPGLVRG